MNLMNRHKQETLSQILSVSHFKIVVPSTIETKNIPVYFVHLATKEIKCRDVLSRDKLVELVFSLFFKLVQSKQ